jgi:hypothetical protein
MFSDIELEQIADNLLSLYLFTIPSIDAYSV